MKGTMTAFSDLPKPFREDVAAYLAACRDPDPLGPIAIFKPLREVSADSLKRRIHRAADALVKSGIAKGSLRALDNLVTAEAFRRILQHCNNNAHDQPSWENWHMAHSLRRIARIWVKLPPRKLEQLKELHRRLPNPKRRRDRLATHRVAQFDDPEKLERLKQLPDQLWSAALDSDRCSGHILAKAQAAIALALEIQLALSLDNLASLEFGRHIFIDAEKRTCTIRLARTETTSGQEIEWLHLPPALADMLIDYHELLAPRLIGRKPTHLFARRTGVLKSPATVRYLLQKHAAVAELNVSPAMFRRLGGERVLRNGGTFGDVANVLGYRKIQTAELLFDDSRREVAVEERHRWLMSAGPTHANCSQ